MQRHIDVIDESLFSTPGHYKKRKIEIKEKNGEERIPTILCMTFRMYNCIRKRPCKKK